MAAGCAEIEIDDMACSGSCVVGGVVPPMTVHIVGGGIAGLAAAVACVQAGQRVVLYDAAPQLGGRCRSYRYDEFDCELDNGAHVVLANNQNIQTYLRIIGANERLQAYGVDGLDCYDLRSQTSWVLRIPGFLFSENARPRDVSASQLLRDSLRVLRGHAPQSKELADALWEPLCKAALNTPMAEGDRWLLSKVLQRMAGWNGLRRGLWLPQSSLTETYIQPAVMWLQRHGATIKTNMLLRGTKQANRFEELQFDNAVVEVGLSDHVILALPPWAPVLKDFGVDSASLSASPIVNVHYKLAHTPPSQFTGIIGGLSQWLWARGSLATVTISAADALVNRDSDTIAKMVWSEISALVGGASDVLPPSHVVKERRATLRHTPACSAARARLRTGKANVTLAGDWTAIDLPGTLEAAAQSGFAAAQHVATGGSI
jgi:hydroxysqualene dehydroxylase